MSDYGRIHCVVVATKAGQVVFERYYDRYTELEKAEIREALQTATDHVNLAHDNHEFVGSFRCAGRAKCVQQQRGALDRQRARGVCVFV